MSRERELLSHGFGPFYDAQSRLLILGSFPSVKSREQAFYYGHPRNRFWPVLAAVCGDSLPSDLEAKKDFLRRHHIALYDVIESCSIIGSADSSIADVSPADLRPILSGSLVGRQIFTNGTKAQTLYRRFLFPTLQIPAIALPSTSPANAACPTEKLIEVWSESLRGAISEPTSKDRAPEKAVIV